MILQAIMIGRACIEESPILMKRKIKRKYDEKTIIHNNQTFATGFQ